MNKDDVYRLISYQGEYNNQVKKAIRKLLKDNHPDNKGDREKFELINEVKNELENNKVPIKYNKKNSEKTKQHDDIDYDFCYERIRLLTKRKEECSKKINEYNSKLNILEDEYRDVYRKSIDLELNLLSSSEEAKKIQNVKLLSITMVIVITILFILSVIKYNIFYLIIFVLLTIICVIIIEKYFILVNSVAKNNKKRLKDYVLINKKIRDNTKNQEELKEQILILSKELNTIENDLRFYNNLLK